MKKIISIISLIGIILSLSGCFTASPETSKMPQGRPANWEYSLPGGFDRGGFSR
jgi:hypothetical protein